MDRSLAPVVQEHIEKIMLGNIRELSSLRRRVDNVSLNVSGTRSDIHDHEHAGFDAHNIKDMILDVINENMLVNSGLELDEQAPGMPDSWVVSGSLGSSNYEIGLTTDYSKYGGRSLKIRAKNPDTAPRTVFIQQDIEQNIFSEVQYTASIYLMSEGKKPFSYIIRIEAYDENDSPLEPMEFRFDTDEDSTLGLFGRKHASFSTPDGSVKLRLLVGIEIEPGTQDMVDAYIDYPSFNIGIAPLRPGEVVEGVLKTRHISTEGLDAKVIKTGVIEITEELSLMTEAGDVRLHHDEANDGNVLEFYNNSNRLVALGKYGPNSIDYGIEIVNEDGTQWIRANAGGISITGHFEATSGTIAGFDIMDDAIVSPGGFIELNSDTKRIVVRDGTSDKVILGQTEPGVYGVDIRAGEINLGDGVFSVDSGGSLTATSGTIGGVDISDSTLSVSDATNKVVTIGEYEPNKYGINITDGIINLGNGKFIADSSGHLTAIDADIGGFIVNAGGIASPSGAINMDSALGRITVFEGSTPNVTIGHLDSNVYGIDIQSGKIVLGGGLFSVDNDGKLTSTSGNIAGITIEDDRLAFPDDTIVLDSLNKRIVVQDDTLYDSVVIGNYGSGTGIRIHRGEINLGDGNFVATSSGSITAIDGTIGNFIMTSSNRSLRSSDDSIILDGDSSEITVSSEPDFATIIAPGGLYGTMPIGVLPTSDFDPTEGGADYYVEVNSVYSGNTTYDEGVDYLYNSITGEIARRKGSSMPNSVTVDFTVFDSRLGDMVEVTGTATVDLIVTQRASHIITDDSLLDAKFIKNLFIGSADIGHAVINTAHINEISGDVIQANTIHGDKIIGNTLDINKLNFIPLSAADGMSTGDIIGSINSSNEGIQIEGRHILITGETTFESGSGLDPREKNKTYKQATAPTSGMIEGDTWINTSDDNNIYVYDGVSWEQPGVVGDFLEKDEYLYNWPNTTTIDGAKIETGTIHANRIISGTISADQIDANAITLEKLEFTPLLSSSGESDIIATINASSEGIIIEGKHIEITGDTTFKAGEDFSDTPFLDKDGFTIEELGETRIRGALIETSSITLNSLNFTPLVSVGSSDEIIATINASPDGLHIEGKYITISGETEFLPGYDPSEKNKTFTQASEPASSNVSEGDVWVKTSEDNKIYVYRNNSWEVAGLDGDFMEESEFLYGGVGGTTIDGAKIQTGTIHANRIESGTITAEQIDANAITLEKLVVKEKSKSINPDKDVLFHFDENLNSTSGMQPVSSTLVSIGKGKGVHGGGVVVSGVVHNLINNGDFSNGTFGWTVGGDD